MLQQTTLTQCGAWPIHSGISIACVLKHVCGVLPFKKGVLVLQVALVRRAVAEQGQEELRQVLLGLARAQALELGQVFLAIKSL